jgi:hypothetical protein
VVQRRNVLLNASGREQAKINSDAALEVPFPFNLNNSSNINQLKQHQHQYCGYQSAVGNDTRINQSTKQWNSLFITVTDRQQFDRDGWYCYADVDGSDWTVQLDVNVHLKATTTLAKQQ